MTQDIFKSLANESCLALCLAKLADVDADMADLMIYVIKGWNKGLILEDGYVQYPCQYLTYVDPKNRCWSYDIINIASLDDLPEGVFPVFYSIDGKNGHFVLASKNGIVWNPLRYSVNVSKGKPVSYRRVEVK